MSKRSNGEGSIRLRADGRWEASLMVTDPVTGKRRRLSWYGKTKTAVREKLKEAVQRADADLPVKDAALTVGEWADRWLSTVLPSSGRRPSTVDVYASLTRTHVVPVLGRSRLAAVKPSDVDALVSGLACAPSTRRQVHTVLRLLFADAQRDGLVARNPVERTRRPSVPPSKPRALTRQQVRAVLGKADGHRHHALLVLVATTGLRRGEALALRWSDLDGDSGVLRVERNLVRADGHLTFGEPKTTRGHRDVPVPPSVLRVLAEHRRRQVAERLACGPDVWQDHGLMFCTEIGTPCEPRNVSRWYATVCAQAGVSDTGMHSLRHAAATAMLDAGVPVRTVADVLGHGDVGLTLNVYAASLPGQAASATAGVADALGI